MRLFGPTQEDLWKMFSCDIDAEFIVTDSVFKKYEVIKKFQDWSIVLDTWDSAGRNKTVYTRIYCVFLNKHGFKFKVFGEYFNNYFPNFFDMQDIKVSYENLSDKLVIRSNSEIAIAQLLQNETIRGLLNMQPEMLFEIVSEEGCKTIANADSKLSVKIPGVIKNNEILKNLFELVGESLLEIERISNEFENLQINNFTHFDVIKNSVKNTLLESDSYKKFSKDIVDNVSKIIDKKRYHHLREKYEENKVHLLSKNLKSKKANNEIFYVENSSKEIKKQE